MKKTSPMSAAALTSRIDTKVMNVKVAHLRPLGFENLAAWMQATTSPLTSSGKELGSNNHVYIGRAGVVFVEGERFPKQASILANPFKITTKATAKKKGAPESGTNKSAPTAIGAGDKTPTTGTRAEVISQYRSYALKRIQVDPKFRAAVKDLRGKTLGCWCKPEACHGDVLVELCTMVNLEDEDSSKGTIRKKGEGEVPQLEVTGSNCSERGKRSRDDELKE